jgi:hypothetical protein
MTTFAFSGNFCHCPRLRMLLRADYRAARRRARSLFATCAMYWDIETYADASWRIASGQVPAVDFFTPAGPLTYYLYRVVEAVFPNGQPVLVASWSVLLITLPAMALVTNDILRRSPLIAVTLVVLFFYFSALPFNTSPLYPFPGADGVGVYNRQGSQILYTLAAAALFVRGQKAMWVIVTLLMTAAFFLKITVFLVGGLICLLGLLAGRIAIKTAIAGALAFSAAVGLAEIATGIVSGYLDDIAVLASMNSGGLVDRYLQGTSRTVGTVLPVLALAAATIFAPLPARSRPLFSRVMRHPALWLPVTMGASVFYESQNAGSQEHIVMIPVVLYAVLTSASPPLPTARNLTIVFLATCSTLPVLTNFGQHSARAIGAMAKQQRLQHDNLGPLGAVTIRPDMERRGAIMRDGFLAHPEFLEDLARANELHAFTLYSDLDFQTDQLKAKDEVVSVLKQVEATGITFDSVMTLGFADPFPRLLGKQATKHISIGQVPTRTVPPMDEDTRAAVADTDIVLEPRCPYTRLVLGMREIYAEALSNHVEVKLTPCYRALLHLRLAEKIGPPKAE